MEFILKYSLGEKKVKCPSNWFNLNKKRKELSFILTEFFGLSLGALKD